VLVIIGNMYVLIYNCFHTRRANSGKITFLWGYPFLTPTFEGNPRTQGHEILSRETRDLRAAHGEDFFDFNLHRFDRVPGCDGQTNRQTDRGHKILSR